MYQMAATMMAPMSRTPKYPTVWLWMFSDVITFFGVCNSLKSSSIGDDIEFPIIFSLDLLECRVLLRLLLACFSSGHLWVPSFLIWMCFFSFSIGELCLMWIVWAMVWAIFFLLWMSVRYRLWWHRIVCLLFSWWWLLLCPNVLICDVSLVLFRLLSAHLGFWFWFFHILLF